MRYKSFKLGKKITTLCCRKFGRSKGREILFDLLSEKINSHIHIANGGPVPNYVHYHRFGALFKFDESGFFWSNIQSPDEFERVLNNVYNASVAEFEQISRPFADQLMVYDCGNTKIRAYVEGVLTDSLESK